VKTEEDVPLVGVMFRIMETGTQNEVARVFTKVRGVFNASNLPAGNFDFEWSFEGYETVAETDVRISAGKELQRRIVMEATVPVEIEEGGLAQNEIGNLPIPAGVNDDSTVTIEALGAQMMIFASSTVNGDITGSGALYVNIGTPLVMKWSQLVAQIGLDAANAFLNIKNVGTSAGAWKVTFGMS
jgi:hypothetical protein